MNKEQEIQLIYNLLIHPAAFDIDIAGYLLVRRYEYSRWAVERYEIEKFVIVDEFDNAMEAAKFFVEKRHELQIGLDFEFGDNT